MTPFYQDPGGLAALDRLYVPIAVSNSRQQDLLGEVHPVVHTDRFNSSPPTNETFQFPTLLECLSDNSTCFDMPRLSDTMTGFDELEPLGQVDLFENITENVSSIECSTPNAEQKFTREEIDKELLRDDYDPLDAFNIDAYTLDAVLQAAKLHYGDKRPEFCIKTPGQTLKEIRLSGTEEYAEIRFQEWSEGLGFWVLTDETNDSYILKCHGSKYYVWEGVEKSFARDPAAYVIKPKDRRIQKQKLSDSNSRHTTDQTNSSLVSSLRERTTRQNMPYTMYKAQKRFEDRGIRLSEEQLAGVIDGDRYPSKAEPNSRPRRHKQDDSLPSDSGFEESADSIHVGVRSSSAVTSVSNEYIMGNTILRTRLHDFQQGTIPILAQQCADHQSFFDAVKRKWAFKLGDRRLLYGVASFPWLGKEKNTLLQECDVDGFKTVMHEVKSAPVWQAEGRIEVLVELYTE